MSGGDARRFRVGQKKLLFISDLDGLDGPEEIQYASCHPHKIVLFMYL
jgi:hypothetical protein